MRVPLRRCKNRQLPVYCNIRKTAWQHVSSDVARRHGRGYSALMRKRITLQHPRTDNDKALRRNTARRTLRTAIRRQEGFSVHKNRASCVFVRRHGFRPTKTACPSLTGGRAPKSPPRKKKYKPQNKMYGKRQREHERKEMQDKGQWLQAQLPP